MYRILKVFLLLVISLVFSNFSFAQMANVEEFMRSGLEDASILIKEYLAPFGKGFGADLNNGWYNTARPHKFLGLDITVTASAAISPTSDATFNLSQLELKNLRLTDPNDAITPTVVGDDEPGPDLDLVLNNPVTGKEELIGTITMPQGIGFRYVPSPMIQASVGLIANTDVMIRFFPEIEINKDIGSLRLLGLGIKHGLNQWLPDGGMLPFDLSVMAGYTLFQAQSKDLDLEPDPEAIPTGNTYNNQEVEVEAKSFTVNLLISKKFAIFTFFGGVGIETSNLDLKLKGTYPITVFDDDQTSPTFGQKVIEDLEDPVKISVEGANSQRATVGLSLQLLFLTIHGSYTFSKYPVATAGVGLSIR
ncbi:MAG: DUF6588 family protein [bacterium]